MRKSDKALVIGVMGGAAGAWGISFLPKVSNPCR